MNKILFSRTARHRNHNKKLKKMDFKNQIIGIIWKDEEFIKKLMEKEKHTFQIMVEYENDDSYTYEAEEFEKIIYKDKYYILLIKGTIDTNELYESDDAIYGNADEKYDYNTLAEIQLRKKDDIKEITMLDCNTGHEYDLTYDLIDEYYNLHANCEELNNINIIDILGEKFIPESIG